jgi:hypothetical protein
MKIGHPKTEHLMDKIAIRIRITKIHSTRQLISTTLKEGKEIRALISNNFLIILMMMYK